MEKVKKVSKFESLTSLVSPEKLEEWKNQQNLLKENLSEKDCLSLENISTFKIAGVDISASKADPEVAVVGLCIIRLSDFNLVYEDYSFVKIVEPYVPGFLAFREVDHILTLFEKIKGNQEIYPDVVLVDGNGILHSNGFGLASHLGVLLDLPTIGCGKTVFSVDGIHKKGVAELVKTNLLKAGDHIELKGESGKIWGAALRSTSDSVDPIIVSIGTKISLDSALTIVKSAIRFRVPEPIRISDLTTRLILREYEKCKVTTIDIPKLLSKQKRDFLQTK